MGATAPSSVQQRTLPVPAGWPIVGWSAVAVAALCALASLAAGAGEPGWRAAIRLSARTSFALFTAAFVASSVTIRWPNPFTRWLLANRRYVGVSFAASHAIHLIAIIGLARVAADFPLAPAALIGGGLAYGFLAAMTATSFDRTAAWLGARRWRLLHKTGMYYCWVIFFITFLPRALAGSAFYGSVIVVQLGALLLRAATRSRGRSISEL